MAAGVSELTVPAHPFVFEIDTWAWLTTLSASAGQQVDLGSVPAGVWDAIAGIGYDVVWLMGVWRRSPAGIAVALQNVDLMASFQEALPDFVDADVVGSPYC